MDAAAETAVGCGDDVLASDQVGEADDAVGDQLGMLDDVGGVADDARKEDLAVGQLDVLPDLPFVLVPDIARLERVGLALTASMTSTMSRIGMSVACGPCQLPQQRWKRMRSSGRPWMAWLSASTRSMVNFW